MKRVTTPGLAAALAALAALAAALVSGCAVDDRELGAAAAAQIDRQVTIVADPAAQQAMQRFGMALVRASERVTGPTDFAWRFRVVEDTAINAFALPGGYVYVHTALIRQADDAAELGGVIGHEIAHDFVAGRDQTQRTSGRNTKMKHCLTTQKFADGGTQHRATIGTTRVRCRPCAFELQLMALAGGIHHFAKIDRAAIPQLPRPVTKLMAAIDRRVRLAARKHAVPTQRVDAFCTLHHRRTQSQLVGHLLRVGDESW